MSTHKSQGYQRTCPECGTRSLVFPQTSTERSNVDIVPDAISALGLGEMNELALRLAERILRSLDDIGYYACHDPVYVFCVAREILWKIKEAESASHPVDYANEIKDGGGLAVEHALAMEEGKSQ